MDLAPKLVEGWPLGCSQLLGPKLDLCGLRSKDGKRTKTAWKLLVGLQLHLEMAAPPLCAFDGSLEARGLLPTKSAFCAPSYLACIPSAFCCDLCALAAHKLHLEELLSGDLKRQGARYGS